MTQASSGHSLSRSAVPARSDIYTVLAVIATVALAIGCGYVWYKNTQLTGQGNPFHIEPAAASR